jgi:hypothetical protein
MRERSTATRENVKIIWKVDRSEQHKGKTVVLEDNGSERLWYKKMMEREWGVYSSVYMPSTDDLLYMLPGARIGLATVKTIW